MSSSAPPLSPTSQPDAKRMKMQDDQGQEYHIILFYKYVQVPDPQAEKAAQHALCTELGLLGRSLVSNEGINATFGGPLDKINAYVEAMIAHPVFAMSIEDFKRSMVVDKAPFAELVIKDVKEIVNTGRNIVPPAVTMTDAERGYLTPQQFHEALAKKDEKPTIVLDVRAHKEFLVGHFKDAVDPQVKNFSEYYAFLDQRIPKFKEEKTTVLMYCTGGIRCEKASQFLRSKGIKDVHHLKGGIHRYLEQFPDGGFFQGKNFVFDKRVLMGPTTADVVGSCVSCSTPYDAFNGVKVCSVCRDLVLVCDPCFQTAHGEVHCLEHRYLKDCYFTFLQYFSAAELEAQVAGLEGVLAALLSEPEKQKRSQNRRRTVRKQLEKVKARLALVQENPSAVETWTKVHCRTCGSTDCEGTCWGFWNEVQ
ncbi:hypothetical protein SPRG_07557 [Saprolegnia parasitica CBS 223.65]|uniref:Rhodanese domain-containing protein n=1 Tax=Saprolegnia parasitica (strain CBS 223.65) TaxID=695850 RepID=A0A067C9Z8_SAPPC|nr:hypothetical protein SPRG_07557 [Saprolegnia parasitica CBS 223.65]KDO27308.1 hypothetical protein SPRG_07557 [Saprolegnia parasitica CBS 223.65]|eukprot:XP_012202081.1 hypothetical protein SPRG_07557 [Saprolegnia parasitica CBS 223.65]